MRIKLMTRIVPGMILLLLLLAGSPSLAAGKKIAVLTFAESFLEFYEGLRSGLAQLSGPEENDLEFVVRSLNGDPSRITEIMTGIESENCSLIYAITTPVNKALQRFQKAQQNPLPVVFVAVADPLGSGLVADLRRPGGNATGVSHISIELLPQRLLLFKKAFPDLRRVAVFFDPEVDISRRCLEDGQLWQAAADSGLDLQVFRVSSLAELKKGFVTLGRQGCDGLFMIPDPLSVVHFKEMLLFSRQAKLPLMVLDNRLLLQGGVMAYSPDFSDVGCQSAMIVEEILRGAVVGDIPVQNPDRVRLVVSLKEAQTLGLEISDDILLLADKVIR